jgi:hypothetical protein
MIQIVFLCDTCGIDVYRELAAIDELRNQPIPTDWIWKDGRAYCHVCKRYSGVTVG